MAPNTWLALMDDPRVLVLNCGSSSVKLALIDARTGARSLTGLADRVGTADATVRMERGSEQHVLQIPQQSHGAVVTRMVSMLSPDERDAVVGVGHRVVHGGDRFAASVVVNDDVLAMLHKLVDLAPLHMPANLAGIAAARDQLRCPHVLVFDTAFHQSMPPKAYRYAVPTSWYTDHDVRRYGFHGTSHRYVSRQAARLLGRPLDELHLVTVHLGNGCSATAVRGGRSIDTTMGMTPLEGLVMGTRSGDVDPGALGYIGERLGLDLAGVLDALNFHSGLLGLSGISNDMRTIERAAQDGSPAATLALEVFCYRAAKTVGALAVALGRLDAVVFTGGIGERSPVVRAAILAQLGLLGLVEDAEANAGDGRQSAGRISLDGPVAALVVPTDEEWEIARDTWELAR